MPAVVLLFAVGLVADPIADESYEVAGGAGQLETDQIRAQQPFQDLAPPRQLGEQFGRRERDVEVEADQQVGAQVAQHLRNQLQLVVLHPHGRTLGGHRSGPVGEALIDRYVGIPPLSVKLGLGHHVVVERPQRSV